MTALALFLALAITPAQQADTVQYSNERLDLTFSYPKNWQLSTNKKGETRALIPIEGSSERALLEIYPTAFRSEASVWQLTQASIAKAMKRNVDRQWEEEILGVPLLLTSTTIDDPSGKRTLVTGLLYSFGLSKMMYKLTTNEADFPKAALVWHDVMLTLRTQDGQMPKPEDPSIKIDMPDPSKVAHPMTPHSIDIAPKRKIVKAPVATTVEVGGKKLELRLPPDWRATAEQDGTFTLRNPAASQPVTVRLYATSDELPTSALLKASATSLDEFTTVAQREENLPTPNAAGAQVVRVWRTGAGAKGELATCEAYGLTGDYYFLARYRAAGPAAGKDRRLLEALFDAMSVEPAP